MWIRHVVLAHLAGAPAGGVEELVVERQVDIRQEWRHRLEALQQRRELVGFGRLGRDVDHLLRRPGAVRLVP